MKWPWTKCEEATALRKDAEARAEQVHAEVVRPLREMRARNHFSDAIYADIRRRLKEGN